MKLQHFLWTPFDLGIYDNQDISDKEEWLRARLDLFKKYCLPSVQKQTCKDFKWGILVDDRSKFLKEFDLEQAMTSKSNMFTISIVKIDPKDIALDILRFQKRNMQDKKVDTHVWTRLSSDNMIHPSFIANIQDAVKTAQIQTAMEISYAFGFCLDIRTNEATFTNYEEPNSFTTTVIGPKGKAEHLMNEKDCPPVVFPKRLRYWVRLIHNHNKATLSGDKTFLGRSGKPNPVGDRLQEFGI